MANAESKTTGGTCPAQHGGKMSDCAAYPACACDYPDMDPPLIHVVTHATEQDKRERRVTMRVSIYRGTEGNG